MLIVLIVFRSSLVKKVISFNMVSFKYARFNFNLERKEDLCLKSSK